MRKPEPLMTTLSPKDKTMATKMLTECHLKHQKSIQSNSWRLFDGLPYCGVADRAEEKDWTFVKIALPMSLHIQPVMVVGELQSKQA